MNAFTLKGGLYTFTTMHLKNKDLPAIHEQLTRTAKKTPHFFDNTPIVIDLQAMTEQINITELMSCLREHKLIPIGVRGGNPEQKEISLTAGLALMPATTQPEAKVSAQPIFESKLITQPVRSGQQIYAEGSDLIVLSPVSAGAEILADGHIHVYAPLRGRALAGVQGNIHARIFCRHLEAELIAIAGHYKISEQLKDLTHAWGKSAVISLEQEQLVIQTLQ